MSCCPCTAPCTECQELRTVPVSDWDWLGQMRSETGFVCYLPEWECFPIDPDRPVATTAVDPMMEDVAMMPSEHMAEHECAKDQ